MDVTRRLVFDPTRRHEFVEQWQRYDWRLLQNSAVHRVDDSASLRKAGELLAGLDYLIHRLDATEWRASEDLHDAFVRSLRFPDYYGRNMSALNDALGDVAQYLYGSDPETTGTAVLIDNYEQVLEVSPAIARSVVDIFASQARLAALLGHPMLCLVVTTADLGEVGAVRVPRDTPLAEGSAPTTR